MLEKEDWEMLLHRPKLKKSIMLDIHESLYRNFGILELIASALGFDQPGICETNLT